MYWLGLFLALLLAVYTCICLGYFFLQERMLFVPFFSLDPRRAKLVVPTEEFTIQTQGGGNIHAVLLSATHPKGLIFYLHGNTGSMVRWQFLAQELCELGYDVFVMDYRGYGRSRGKRSEALMHRDVETCFDFACQCRQYAKVIVYGRSLGCAFAVHLAANATANGLVLETPFFNLPRLAKFYLPYLPLAFLMRYKFYSDHWIARVKMPVIIFHGTRDDVVPYGHAFDLFDLARKAMCQVKMVTIVGGKHSDLNSYALFNEKRADFLFEVTKE